MGSWSQCCNAVLLAVTLTCSCQLPVVSEHLDPQDSITFNTGFPLVPRYSGVFLDKTGGEHFYFGDAMTQARLCFFDRRGKLEATISLKAGMDSIGEIGGISVVNWDSIVLNQMKGEEVAFLDSAGLCWDVVRLKSYLRNDQGDHFELGGSALCGPYMDGAFFFRAYWLSNEHDDLTGIVPTGLNIAYIKYLHASDVRAPYLARVSIVDDVPDIVWGPDSFYYRIRHAISAFNEAPHYCCVNHKVFAYSNYSPALYEVNPRTMRTVRSVKVFSRYSPVHVEPPPLDDDEMRNHRERLTIREHTKGAIYSMGYDQPSGHYLVAVLHEVPEDTPPERLGYRPLSLIEFDKDFTKLNEYLFDDQKYQLGYMLSTRSGLYLKRTESKREMAGGSHTFTRFSFDDK